MSALAAAIELSGAYFIWCVKEIKGIPESGLIPDGFADRLSGKGLIIRGWAPQVDILRHRALGAFLTHCGWNSILEGIVSNVPMITWPIGADQFINAKFLVNNIRVAIQGCEGGDDNVPNVSVLSRAINESLRRDSDWRDRLNLSDAAREAVEGGSSRKDLDNLIYKLNKLQQK